MFIWRSANIKKTFNSEMFFYSQTDIKKFVVKKEKKN